MREAFAALRALHDRARMNNVAAVMMQKRKAWHTADRCVCVSECAAGTSLLPSLPSTDMLASRVFREWRAFAKACAQERESELAIIAFRRQRAAEQVCEHTTRQAHATSGALLSHTVAMLSHPAS